MWPMSITYICRPRPSWVASMDTILPSRLSRGCRVNAVSPSGVLGRRFQLGERNEQFRWSMIQKQILDSPR